MSAFDITGAIVWGLLALTGWPQYLGAYDGWDDRQRTVAFALMLAITSAFIFCIARLLGAST